MPERPRFSQLFPFWIANYLALLVVCSLFFDFSSGATSTTLFRLALMTTYPLIYLMPSMVLTMLLYRLNTTVPHRHHWAFLIKSGVILATSLTVVLLVLDLKVYGLYGFHINSFVLNLMLTPGGIDSLGADLATKITIGFMLTLLLLLETFVFWLSTRFYRVFNRRSLPRIILAFLLTLTIYERVAFGFSDINYNAEILESAQKLPLYSELRFRSLGKLLGMERPARSVMKVGESDALPNYPLEPLVTNKPTPPYNVIWLVAESLRWDMLDAEIMPATWSFAKTSLHLKNHYSGGNGTRQGMFALFYGLHGSYWDRFLSANVGPVVFDHLLGQGYQFGLYTGAAFTYPEFDRTVFARFTADQLHHFDADTPPEERDEKNVQSLIEMIKHRNPDKPFGGFIFFESTHARYFFPDEAIIRQPILENLNYAMMTRDSLRSEIVGLKNRYINASRHVDNQIALLLNYLRDAQLMDNTIVLITGDHGEEFMEKGHWGHNNGFSEEQIRVPFVFHIPSVAGREITETTSHIDIVPTLLPVLGIANPAQSYSLGVNILAGPVKRNFVAVAGTNSVCYIDNAYKFTIPMGGDGTAVNTLTDRGDTALYNDAIPFLQSHGADLAELTRETKMF